MLPNLSQHDVTFSPRFPPSFVAPHYPQPFILTDAFLVRLLRCRVPWFQCSWLWFEYLTPWFFNSFYVPEYPRPWILTASHLSLFPLSSVPFPGIPREITIIISILHSSLEIASLVSLTGSSLFPIILLSALLCFLYFCFPFYWYSLLKPMKVIMFLFKSACRNTK